MFSFYLTMVDAQNAVWLGKSDQPSVANAASESESAIIQLSDHLQARFELMKDVAAYKWVHQMPIEDLVREVRVVEAAMQYAATLGLAPGSIQPMVSLEIKLSKKIQQYWFAQWTKAGFDTFDYADLANDIRPELIEMETELMHIIKKLRPWKMNFFSNFGKRKAMNSILQADGLSEQDKYRMFAAVAKVKQAN